MKSFPYKYFSVSVKGQRVSLAPKLLLAEGSNVRVERGIYYNYLLAFTCYG